MNDAELTESLKFLDALKDKRAELSFELKNIEKKIAQQELELQTYLEGEKLEYKTYGGFSFGWVIKTRTAFDQKLFSEEQPELFQKYKQQKERRDFEFKYEGAKNGNN